MLLRASHRNVLLPIDCDNDDQVRALVAELTSVAIPITDVRASEAYRRAMTVVLAIRAIKAAAIREDVFL